MVAQNDVMMTFIICEQVMGEESNILEGCWPALECKPLATLWLS
jgi:hypothetical protein